MARPRSDHVPTESGVCPKHGVVELRIHKIGRRKNGTQKYRKRCPQCHSERNSRLIHSVNGGPGEASDESA